VVAGSLIGHFAGSCVDRRWRIHAAAIVAMLLVDASQP
jgi:hypothetical protein